MLQTEDLSDPAVQEQVTRILSQVDRSSGSSGWLKDLFLREYDEFDAMVNFEHTPHRVWLDVKDANQRAQAVYASEGFVRDGLLREVLREEDGSWSSLVMMSRLETERGR